jgi:hypothetical protein
LPVSLKQPGGEIAQLVFMLNMINAQMFLGKMNV